MKTKLTKKQFLVYTFLLSISKWDAQTKEEHYYVYKNSFVIKDACAKIGISQPTWRAAIKKLKDEFYIQEYDNWFTIDFPATYAPLNIKLISLLLEFSIVMNNGGNLVGVYATLYRYWSYCKNNGSKCCITINQLLKLFEATFTHEAGRYYEVLLGLFYSQGLITMKMNTKKYLGQDYTEYEILDVNCQLPVSMQERNFGPDDIKDIIGALQNSID